VDEQVSIMIMSGVDDGTLFSLSSDSDGTREDTTWTLSIGRREDNDICLRNDTFTSRYHARIHWRDGRWWLEDLNSKNGTFLDSGQEDARVSGTIPLETGQLFRIGRTWLRLQAAE
jgi:pSer/pThr/pTyr-binding forkhead associated (FHA) protein